MANEISHVENLIKIIEDSRNNAYRKVNEELIRMYWNVGKYLSREGEKAFFGDAYIDSIVKEIQSAFPGIKGFNRRGLYRMKQFYETYCGDEFVSALLTQISWTNKHAVHREIAFISYYVESGSGKICVLGDEMQVINTSNLWWEAKMDLRFELIELRKSTGMNRKEFAAYFAIPYRTIQDWELGNRKMPEYLFRLMAYKVGIERLVKENHSDEEKA